MMRKKRRLNVESGKSIVTASTSNNKGSNDDEEPQVICVNRQIKVSGPKIPEDANI